MVAILRFVEAILIMLKVNLVLGFIIGQAKQYFEHEIGLYFLALGSAKGFILVYIRCRRNSIYNSVFGLGLDFLALGLTTSMNGEITQITQNLDEGQTCKGCYMVIWFTAYYKACYMVYYATCNI